MKCEFCPCDGCDRVKGTCKYGQQCKRYYEGTTWLFSGGCGCKQCADKYFKGVLETVK